MKPEKKQRIHINLKRINSENELELAFWAKKFGCSKEALKRALRAVGNSPEKVERYLNYK